jgi:transposase
LRAANARELQKVGKHQPAASGAELELIRLKRELAEVKTERDLLQKFAAYFANDFW